MADGQRETDKQIGRRTKDMKAGRQRDRQTGRQAERQAERQADRQIESEVGRERQASRETDRGRQTDTQTETDSHSERRDGTEIHHTVQADFLPVQPYPGHFPQKSDTGEVEMTERTDDGGGCSSDVRSKILSLACDMYLRYIREGGGGVEGVCVWGGGGMGGWALRSASA